jgi:hypothetical protein
MAGYTETIEHWIEEDDMICLFPELYKGVEHDNVVTHSTAEVDDELGLELVPDKPSIFAKYGVQCDPTKNSFHKSLYDQYQARGSLSEKQINALRKTY